MYMCVCVSVLSISIYIYIRSTKTLNLKKRRERNLILHDNKSNRIKYSQFIRDRLEYILEYIDISQPNSINCSELLQVVLLPIITSNTYTHIQKQKKVSQHKSKYISFQIYFAFYIFIYALLKIMMMMFTTRKKQQQQEKKAARSLHEE